MTQENLMSRFEGEDGRRRLLELVRAQTIIGGDINLASEIAAAVSLQKIAKGEILMRQDAIDNDLYLVLSGALRIVVNGRDVALRKHGEHVGEMAILDPAAARTATVVASESALVARISEADFARIASEHSNLWRALALQLCRRLDERKRFHAEPNVKPVIFIGSSKEHLPIAEAIAAAVPSQTADVVLWSMGVFRASSFPIDDLDAKLRAADFAVLVGGTDDQVTSRGVQSDAPRDNVVFELGLFMGALSRYRTFLVVPKGANLKIPTDLLGLNHLLYDAAATDPAAAVKSAARELVDIVTTKGPK